MKRCGIYIYTYMSEYSRGKGTFSPYHCINLKLQKSENGRWGTRKHALFFCILFDTIFGATCGPCIAFELKNLEF